MFKILNLSTYETMAFCIQSLLDVGFEMVPEKQGIYRLAHPKMKWELQAELEPGVQMKINLVEMPEEDDLDEQ